MTTCVGILVAGVALLTGCTPEGDTIYASKDREDQIHVMGSARVKAVPDIARVQIGVQIFDASLDEALAQNNSRSAAVIASLVQEGVAEGDVQTTMFQVSVQRDYKREESDQIVGYWVQNQVVATIRDLDRVGQVLQTALEAGANNVYSLAFAVDDPEPLWREARAKAVEDARQRAQTLAEAAGVELGKVVFIDEMTGGGGPIYRQGEFDDEAASVAVPIQPGELELRAQVEVIFQIR